MSKRRLPIMGANAMPPTAGRKPDWGRTIHFVSLGCPKNRVDTEVMAGISTQAGFTMVAEPERASVIVVNTCGFIGPAKEESIDTVLEMGRFKESGSCERLVVAGCLAQRYPRELAAELPEVDHFLGTSDLLALESVLRGGSERSSVGRPGTYLYSASTPRNPSTPRHTAYLKIAEGCSRSCAFCVIPSMRGPQRSRPIEDVAAEAQALVEQGALELNLVSQDTIAYGRDLRDGTSLAGLLRALGKIGGLTWIRVLYLYPERFSDELIEVLASEPRVVRYIDIPLQHASTRMLRRMRRGVGAGRQRALIERLRRRIENVTIRTAFIVGHPGETEEDFEELCELVQWAEFERMGVFRYSSEEGTPAGEMDGRVSGRDAARRHRKLMSLQRRISRACNRAMIGRRIEVLVEGVSAESELLLVGRHAGQAPDIDGLVYLADCDEGRPLIGTMVQATVTQSSDYDLVASVSTKNVARAC